MDKPTLAELRAENRVLRRHRTAEVIVSLGRTLITGIVVVACMHYAAEIVGSLAGRQTSASIGVDLLGDLRLSEVVFALVGGGGVAYGIGERANRKRGQRQS